MKQRAEVRGLRRLQGLENESTGTTEEYITMVTTEDFNRLTTANGNVIGTDGEKIGGIGGFYVDDETDQPSWVTVKTGLFGMHESFVPLDGANIRDDDLVVPYTKDQVKDAPRVEPDGHLEHDEEDRLYRHYGRTASTGADTSFATSGTGRDGDVDTRGTAGGTQERDYEGSAGGVRDVDSDGSMTRSEERLNVGTERQETGRARLRKYVTTENVTKTVPVQREEVRVEREPITGEDRDSATRSRGNGDLSESEHEVTLHEERPVVDKETVPVEKVHLGTETVTGEETVSEDVGKEHIDVDGADGTQRRNR